MDKAVEALGLNLPQLIAQVVNFFVLLFVLRLVAYKPIGITDYVRFVTNKDRSSNTIVLGATPFPLEDGKPFRTYWNGPSCTLVPPSRPVTDPVTKIGTRKDTPIARLAKPEIRGSTMSSLSFRSTPHEAAASSRDRANRPMVRSSWRGSQTVCPVALVVAGHRAGGQ